MTPLGRRPLRAIRHVLSQRAESAAIQQFAEQIHTDLVYGNTMLASWALRIARQIRRPCVMHIHEGPRSFPGFLYRSWVRRIGAQASLILVVSEEIQEAFRDYASKVIRVENGLNLKAFLGLPEKRRAPGMRDAVFHILCVSHLMEGKGQHELVRQLPAILQRIPTARVTFVGGTNGVRRNEAYMKFLKELGEQLHVQDRIAFAGPQRDLARWFQSCDTFVNTSPYETFGLTIIEALAAGVPVISKRVGVVGELVNRRMPGLYAIEHSWEELPALLGGIDSSGYEGFRASRAGLLEPYRIEVHAKRIATLLLQLSATLH